MSCGPETVSLALRPTITSVLFQEKPVKKFITPAIVIASAVALAACSPAAKNETAEAADQIGADANATLSQAIDDTDAAANRAFGAAETKLDNASAAIGNAADHAADKTGAALKDAGNAIEE